MKLPALACAVVLLFSPYAVVAQALQPLAKLAMVSAGSGDEIRQYFGRVVARQTVDLAFQVGGQILEFPVAEGSQVAAGALIAELDLEPFQLALDQANAQAGQADRALARLERLRGGAVSQVAVDDAKTQSELAAIAVRNAERALEQATLHAPFDALVASRNIANFSSVSAGSPIVRLHDMSELHIEIDVPEVQFQGSGQEENFEVWAEFPASDEKFPLALREFNAEVSQVGQTFTITLGMAPPENLIVLPGSSANVKVRFLQEASFVTVPQSAVITANDGTAQVMLFEPAGADEGQVRRADIKIAPSGSGAVQVLSGLEAGQEIVVSGAALLEDGAQVMRFTGFSN